MFRSSYFPRHYFLPSYFPGHAAPAEDDWGGSDYFTRDYFPGKYFAPTYWPSGRVFIDPGWSDVEPAGDGGFWSADFA